MLSKISFTGPDNKTNIEDLKELQIAYPIIEWAILYFPAAQGKPRNPTYSWREKFYKAKLNSAMHLCATGINQFADGNSELLNEIENFQRIQINLKPKWASPELVESIIKQCEKFPEIQFITQYNEQNTEYLPLWENLKNHAFLFDSSLGKGISPDTWPSPVKNKDCGYAGGLSPDNIKDEMNKIKNAVKNSKYGLENHIWIDMESGVRTNNEFDLDKVKRIINSLIS